MTSTTTASARLVVGAGEKLIPALVTMEVDHLHQAHEPTLTAGQHRELEVAVRRRLQAALRPWLSLPEPDPFEKGYEKLRAAASALNTDAGLGPAANRVSNGFSPIDTQISYVRSKLEALQGKAVDAFRLGYMTPLPTVVQGQCSVTVFLGSVLLAEKRLVLGAARDVLALAVAATQVAEGGGGEAGPLPLRTAQATVGAASSLVNGTRTEGEEAAGTLLGPLSGLLPTGPVGTAQVSLSGARWYEVVASFEKALDEVNRTLAAGEVALLLACTNAAGVMAGHAELFDLASPTALLKSDDAAELGAGTHGDDLRADLKLMTDLGRVQVPAIAGMLAHADAQLDEVLPGASWRRSDDVGYSSTGPRDAWTNLLHELRRVLHDTQGELVAAGEHLMIAGKLVDESDHEVRDELAKHTAATRSAQEAAPITRLDTPVPSPAPIESGQPGHWNPPTSAPTPTPVAAPTS